MTEHVLSPLRAAELVVPADRGHEVGTVVEAGVGHPPRAGGDVGVFDTDRGGVGVPVPGMPGGVAVPHELADLPVGLHLVVGRGLAGLPHVPAAPDRQVAGVVVDDHLVDLPAGSSGGVVLVHDEVDVGLKGVPVLHRCSLLLLLLISGWGFWPVEGWASPGLVGDHVEGVPHLCRYRQTEAGGVFDQGDAFVGQVEEDDCRAQHAGGADHLGVEQMGEADEGEDQDFAGNPAKPHCARDAAFVDGCEDSGDVVGDGEEAVCVGFVVALGVTVAQRQL